MKIYLRQAYILNYNHSIDLSKHKTYGYELLVFLDTILVQLMSVTNVLSYA